MAKNLGAVRSLRILIGNTSNPESLEQIAEGYQRLELPVAADEREPCLKRSEQRQRAQETADNLRHTIEKMDQTDDSQNLIRDLFRMVQEKRLAVRVYTKGRLHAKAYQPVEEVDFQGNRCL